MSDSLNWLQPELESLARRGLLRQLAERSTAQQACIELNGQRLLNFGSNDYLGLANGRLIPAVTAALERCGWGAGASPLVSGRAVGHAQLETRLAEFEGTQSALLFPTGYAANLGTLCALVGKQDVVFSDSKNHASLIDGCRLSGAQIEVYPHANVTRLKEQLRGSTRFRRRLIVTDGLFSMDGDLAPLPDIVALAREFDAMLMVDEAHATGVFGAMGRGACEHLGIEKEVPIRVGTLSKGLGSMGGFVVGSARLIRWLSNQARPYVFSTAAPEALTAAGLRALEIVEQEPERRQTLLHRAERFRQVLRANGWQIGHSTSQIIPLILGDVQRTMDAAAALRQAGFFVPAIRPPSVPGGEALLRISLSYSHTPEMLEALLNALRQTKDSDPTVIERC